MCVQIKYVSLLIRFSLNRVWKKQPKDNNSNFKIVLWLNRFFPFGFEHIFCGKMKSGFERFAVGFKILYKYPDRSSHVFIRHIVEESHVISVETTDTILQLIIVRQRMIEISKYVCECLKKPYKLHARFAYTIMVSTKYSRTLTVGKHNTCTQDIVPNESSFTIRPGKK